MRDRFVETWLLGTLSAAHFLEESKEACTPYQIAKLYAKLHKRRIPNVQAISQALHRLESRWLVLEVEDHYQITKQGFLSFCGRYFERTGPAGWLSWLDAIGKWTSKDRRHEPAQALS